MVTKYKSAQSGTEYLIISSITLMIVIPTIFAFFSYSKDKAAEIEENQLYRVGNRLIIEAKDVYFQGKGSKSTIRERLPSLIENITYFDNPNKNGGEFVFYFKKTTNLPGIPSVGFPIDVPISFNEKNVFWGEGLREIVFVGMENITTGEIYVQMKII